uniref:Uncharacterized protein n=1 Tax=Arundo donax TaxID=35708 RepID=A0A0A9ABC5_ARUDO
MARSGASAATRSDPAGAKYLATNASSSVREGAVRGSAAAAAPWSASAASGMST